MTHHIQSMLQSHPQFEQTDISALVECLEACFNCVQTCHSCADACLAEDSAKELAHCIRLNLDCADVCEATGKLFTRQTSPDQELLRSQLEACVIACRQCGQECDHHSSQHEHCRICAEVCRHCESACQRLLQAAPAHA